MAIVPKNKATIVPRSMLHYDKSTFDEHKEPMFTEATAEHVLANIKPITLFEEIGPMIAVDTETYAYPGLHSNKFPSNVVRRWINNKSKTIPNDFPFCISISDGINSYAVYDTLENKFTEFKKLAPLLMDRSIAKCGHNMNFDLHMLANANIDMRGRFYDTSYMSKLTRADAFTHNLLDISTEIYDEAEYPTVTKFERMVGSYKAQYRITDYRMFPKELMTQYTCADTWNAIWVLKKLYKKLIENDQLDLFNIESEVLLVTYRMERQGIVLDPEYGPELIAELKNEVDEAERKIYETAGGMFNINSSKQLETVLTKLGYGRHIKYKSPTDAMLAKGIVDGNPSFDKFQMERLEELGVPLIKDIQQFRKSEKLLNTFAIKLYELCDAGNVVHCNINTMEAKTGRFSISNPSMQNMPRRSDSRVRQAFVAPEGYTLYDFDFKAQESLIMTHYSRAPYLLDIVNNGGDIHRAVAAIIYDVPLDQVDKKLRDIAKSVEFAIVYGAGPDRVKAMTGLTLEEARSAIVTFKRRVPEVEMFIKTANRVIKERGCIKTILGRRVYGERGREYACVNYLCQGSAADSTKQRMIYIYRFLKANNYKTMMILQVHDSLLQQVYNEEADEIIPYLRWLQTERDLFRVTVTVDVAKCYPTWRQKEDVDVAAIKPPEELLDKMVAYDIWNEGIL
jgi:DNA polymerase-1